jgi:hypothetical protein
MEKLYNLDRDLTPVEMQLLADQIKRLYISARRQQHEKYKLISSRWKDVWLKAAKFVKEHRISPSDLVTLAFQIYYPFPHPNQLVSRGIINELAKTDNQFVDIYDKNYLNRELDELKTYIDIGFTPEEVLLNENCKLTNLFRYSIAMSLGFSGIADRFLKPAQLELERRKKEYLQLLPILPPELKD